MIALAAVLLLVEAGGPRAHAENAMGYQLLSEQEARDLPHNRGAFGIDLTRSQRITDHGMAFDIMQVTGVKPGSPGAKAGFRRGDQIIAVNGRLFPSLNVFAAYVGSMQPGSVATVDYMPAGDGPAQAERVAVTVGGVGPSVPGPEDDRQKSDGMSTATKLAIGAGAVALLGCYEFGCFSRHPAQPPER